MLSLYLPFSDTYFPVLLLFGLGAAIGLLGGFFGVGGGWIITPALNIFGMPMPYAVGTGFGYIMGMSFISAGKHGRHGNLEVRLALIIGITMMAGVQAGKMLMSHLVAQGSAEPVIRTLYVLFLYGLGIFMLAHCLIALNRTKNQPEAQQASEHRAPLQRLRLRPIIFLPVCRVYVSLWTLLAIGLLAGFLSGILGVGGGFMLMPIMIYLIGVPTVVAVGTSLLCLLLASPFGVLAYSGIFSAFSQSIKQMGLADFLITGVKWPEFLSLVKQHNHVEFVAALIMIFGALVGAPLGVNASRIVKGESLRLLYAVLILLGGTSVLLKLIHAMAGFAEGQPSGWDFASKCIILGSAGGMSLVILTLSGITRLRQLVSSRSGESPASAS